MIMTSCALCVEEGEVGRREKGRFARARLGHLHAGHAHRRHVRKYSFVVSHPSIDCRNKQGIAWGVTSVPVAEVVYAHAVVNSASWATRMQSCCANWDRAERSTYPKICGEKWRGGSSWEKIIHSI